MREGHGLLGGFLTSMCLSEKIKEVNAFDIKWALNFMRLLQNFLAFKLPSRTDIF